MTTPILPNKLRDYFKPIDSPPGIDSKKLPDENVIAKAWEEYFIACYSTEGVARDSVQYVELRKAFYGGVWAMHCLAAYEITAMLDGHAMAQLSMIEKECRDFYQTVIGAG